MTDGRRLPYDHGVVVKSSPPSIDPTRPARSRFITAPDSPFPPLAIPPTHDPFAHGPDHEMEENDLTVWQRRIQEFHQHQLGCQLDGMMKMVWPCQKMKTSCLKILTFNLCAGGQPS